MQGEKNVLVYSKNYVTKETYDRSLSIFEGFLYWWKDEDNQLSFQQRFQMTY